MHVPYPHAVVESLGVCYGMTANTLPAARTVLGLFKSNGIKSMRLYAPDQATLQAVGGTGIYVVVAAPNDVLPNLAASPAAAASRRWGGGPSAHPCSVAEPPNARRESWFSLLWQETALLG